VGRAPSSPAGRLVMRGRRGALGGLLLVPLIVLVSGAARRAEAVTFESLTNPPVELTALLYRPDGAGPFGAMVLLHGCSGIIRTEYGWATEFQKMGYAALIVDSFRPRGHAEICTDFRRVSRRERVLDAYGALRWLRAQPFIDARRIGVAGWSNGGFTVLQVMDQARERPADGFRAAVAVYPDCRFDKTTRFYAPLLILIGGRDDWTPAASCQELAASGEPRPAPVLLHVYPDAYHSFDNPTAARQYLPNVENANKPGGGATIGHDPAARADAIARVERFLAEHLHRDR
jgi:dienelactone hydrolase